MAKINWDKSASEIIELIGGKENINEIFHCATRLRFYLKDESKMNLSELKNHSSVKGYKKQDEQHQLIIGAGSVDKMQKAIDKIIDGKSKSDDFIAEKSKTKLWRKDLSFGNNTLNISKRGLNSFASIFVPLVPVFIAGGMSLALMSLINQISSGTGIAKILDIIGGGILGSIPVFVGYTAAKRWGGNPFLGMAMGLILIAPSLLNRYSTNTPVLLGFDINADPGTIASEVTKHFNEYITNKGITVEQAISQGITESKIVGVYYTVFSGIFKVKLIGYQAQIVPVLLVLALSVNLEKVLRRFVPDVIGIIVVPLVTVIGSSWLSFWLIGPLGEIIGNGISQGLSAIFKYTNWNFIGFGGSILAGAYPLLVVTGLHQGFLPIETQLLVDTTLQYGHSFSFITPIACVSNVAQGTACLMLFFFVKDKKEKSKAVSGAFGGYTGITEPAMFGVNLQLKPLFVGAIIGSAIGGWWLGMTHTVANSLGSASWIGLVQFDWIVEHTKRYFEIENIHAIMKGIPMGAHIAIAISLSTVATAGTSFGLLKTKWGKNSLNNYLNNSN